MATDHVERLGWVGYTARDDEQHQRLHGILASRLTDVVDRFFLRLTKLPEFLLAVGDSARMMLLRAAIAEHLEQFGASVGGAAFPERRLRLGASLALLGAPLPLCVCSLPQLEAVIAEILQEEAVAAAEREKLAATLRKILQLELSYVLDGYRNPARMAPVAATIPAEAPPELELEPEPLVYDEPGILGELATMMRDSDQTGRGLAIGLVKLDETLRLEQAQGREVLEELRQAVAKRLAETVRPDDAVGLYSEGTILVLLRDVGTRDAVAAAERFRALIAREPVETSNGRSHFITIGQGVTAFRPGLSATALIERATDALASAQRGSRDRVVASTG